MEISKKIDLKLRNGEECDYEFGNDENWWNRHYNLILNLILYCIVYVFKIDV